MKAADQLPLLCRFSDAGNDGSLARSGGRRPKSAKARNRGRQCGGRYGELSAAREFEAV